MCISANQMMQSCSMQLKLVQPLKVTGQVSIRRDNFPYAKCKKGVGSGGPEIPEKIEEESARHHLWSKLLVKRRRKKKAWMQNLWSLYLGWKGQAWNKALWLLLGEGVEIWNILESQRLKCSTCGLFKI